MVATVGLLVSQGCSGLMFLCEYNQTEFKSKAPIKVGMGHSKVPQRWCDGDVECEYSKGLGISYVPDPYPFI